MRALGRSIAAVAVAGVLAVAAPARLLAATAAPEALLESAKRAFDRKHYREAERLGRQVVSRHPKSRVAVEAWLVVIDSLVERGRLPWAFQECEKLLSAEPETAHQTAILSRELRIGKALMEKKANLWFARVPRTQEGAEALEKMIEHAPFGPLADAAILAIAEARFRDGDYEAARDQYGRLLKHYPDSTLAVEARSGRARCNRQLAAGPDYDLEPAEEAEKDLALLKQVPGQENAAERAAELVAVRARSDYEAGLFFFEHLNIEGGMLYMGSVLVTYPDTPYASRARRLLEAIIAHYADTPFADQAQEIMTNPQGRVNDE